MIVAWTQPPGSRLESSVQVSPSSQRTCTPAAQIALAQTSAPLQLSPSPHDQTLATNAQIASVAGDITDLHSRGAARMAEGFDTRATAVRE